MTNKNQSVTQKFYYSRLQDGIVYVIARPDCIYNDVRQMLNIQTLIKRTNI